MRKAELERYRALLQAQLSTLTQHASAPVPELEEDVAELPDPSDRATRETEIASELLLRERERALIPEVREALARLDAGEFGACTSCGEPIDPARLRARPSTALCIACQQENERGGPRVNGAG